jgi:sec-independent protein translocase protein TatA
MLSASVLPLANFGTFFGLPGIVILVLGLLIFGRRLPEMGKNIGRTIVEFKKGLSGISEDVKAAEEEEEAKPAAKSLPPSKRTATARKRLPETEEV